MQPTTQDIECDILVLGGGLGGCAAAIRAARQGHNVCLTEATPWLGGQLTSQGVSTLDEHQQIEYGNATALYRELREQIRSCYLSRYQLSEKAQLAPFFNPGDSWGHSLSCEPRVGLAALLAMALPEVEAGRLRIFYHAHIVDAERTGSSIRTLSVAQADFNRHLRFHAAYYLDATEYGDLLPLLDIPFATDTVADPSFSYALAVDYQTGDDHTQSKPPNYAYNRQHSPYAFDMPHSALFESSEDLPGSLWTQRRILAADQFAPGQVAADIILLRWVGNTCHGGNIATMPRTTRGAFLQKGKDLSLGLLYWLQTEVPRHDGRRRGYPELRLRRDIMGSNDGLSQCPYSHQSRRIIPHQTFGKQDLFAPWQSGVRSAFFADSIGICYPPVHHLLTNESEKPFQIPLSAMITRDIDNMLPACKNLGISAEIGSSFHSHPSEWNIGEVAGSLAGFCLEHRVKPSAIVGSEKLLHAFQVHLLQQGVPLYCYDDLPVDHPASTAAQLLALRHLWLNDENHLHFYPDHPMRNDEINSRLNQAQMPRVSTTTMTRSELAQIIARQRCNLHI